MKDLCQLIQGNNLEVLKRRRKIRKGSALARHALKEAMGGHSGVRIEGSKELQKIDWDRAFPTSFSEACLD